VEQAEMFNKQFWGKQGATRLIVYLAVVLILALLPVFSLPTYYIHVFIGIFIYILAAVSLRLVNLSGQGSLGHAGFMLIGAYVSALLSKNLHWTPFITMIIGAVFALGIGFLVAIPFSRLRGIYFTMISLFFGMAVVAFAALTQNITGGESGLANIPALFGISKIPYYYFYLFVMTLCLVIMYRIEFSRIGLTWKAIAQSYSVSSSIGINEAGQRMMCLALGGFFAGIAGALYAHYYQILTINVFSSQTSIYIFIYMMVGGVNSFSGPILGTLILIFIPTIFRNLKEYVPFIYAAILLIVLFLMPQGLAGLPDQIRNLIRKMRNDKVIPPEEVVNNAPRS
jgi:branched-chain amino acid transport system permease protein